MITLDEFKRLQLVVGRVISAERVPKADKLLVLTVDLGDSRRTLVAGIAQFYQPEQVVGKLVVVVANLAPATIRGIESQGMLLAAQDPHTGSVVLIGPWAEVEPGSPVS